MVILKALGMIFAALLWHLGWHLWKGQYKPQEGCGIKDRVRKGLNLFLFGHVPQEHVYALPYTELLYWPRWSQWFPWLLFLVLFPVALCLRAFIFRYSYLPDQIDLLAQGAQFRALLEEYPGLLGLVLTGCIGGLSGGAYLGWYLEQRRFWLLVRLYTYPWLAQGLGSFAECKNQRGLRYLRRPHPSFLRRWLMNFTLLPYRPGYLWRTQLGLILLELYFREGQISYMWYWLPWFLVVALVFRVWSGLAHHNPSMVMALCQELYSAEPHYEGKYEHALFCLNFALDTENPVLGEKLARIRADGRRPREKNKETPRATCP